MNGVRCVALAALLTASLGGCAAIFDGTSQEIAVNTTPPGARCDFKRNNQPLGSIASTPGSLKVQKTKHDIIVACTKDGYQETTYIDHSGVAGATFANVLGGIATGGVAWAVDSGSGADNKYDSPINMTLLPNTVPVSAAITEAPAAPAKPVPTKIAIHVDCDGQGTTTGQPVSFDADVPLGGGEAEGTGASDLKWRLHTIAIEGGVDVQGHVEKGGTTSTLILSLKDNGDQLAGDGTKIGRECGRSVCKASGRRVA
jgi:hypothetical protein